MAVTGSDTVKKRKPPKFVHLPRDRGMYYCEATKRFVKSSLIPAAKLKKEWVQKAKIKSHWKAQKRKEGIELSVPGALGSTRPMNGGDDETPASGNDEGKDAETDLPQRPSSSQKGKGRDIPRIVRPSSPDNKRKHEHRSDYAQNNGRGPSTAAPNSSTQDEERARIQELERKAYSKEALHNYRSDPLGRRKKVAKGGGGDSKHVRTRVQSSRGGQPNMKYRMEALLEKIKQGHKDG